MPETKIEAWKLIFNMIQKLPKDQFDKLVEALESPRTRINHQNYESDRPIHFVDVEHSETEAVISALFSWSCNFEDIPAMKNIIKILCKTPELISEFINVSVDFKSFIKILKEMDIYNNGNANISVEQESPLDVDTEEFLDEFFRTILSENVKNTLIIKQEFIKTRELFGTATNNQKKYIVNMFARLIYDMYNWDQFKDGRHDPIPNEISIEELSLIYVDEFFRVKDFHQKRFNALFNSIVLNLISVFDKLHNFEYKPFADDVESLQYDIDDLDFPISSISYHIIYDMFGKLDIRNYSPIVVDVINRFKNKNN